MREFSLPHANQPLRNSSLALDSAISRLLQRAIKPISLAMLVGVTAFANPVDAQQRRYGMAPGTSTARPSSAQSNSARPQVSFMEPPPAVNSLNTVGTELADLISSVAPAVVHIRSLRGDGNGNVTHEETGSGVLMKDLTPGAIVVVTNRHVVADADLQAIEIRLADGREFHPIEKAEDKATDLAVLRLRERGLPTVEWGDSQALRVGHLVIACGSPFGLSESITLGIVSATGRRALDLDDRGSVINQDFLQTDAAINPGNSGGPLIGMKGRVVGINTAIASKSGGNDGIGFSIPAALARYITTQLLKDGEIQRGFLGVTLDDAFSADTARRLNLSKASGAHVTGVHPGSPAALAGLREDDVVVQFHSAAVEDERHLIHLVSLTPPRQQVPVVVMRRGQRIVLNVTLQKRTRVSVELSPNVPRMMAVPGNRRISDSRQLDLPMLVPHGGALLVTQAADPLRMYDRVLKVDRKTVQTPAEWNTRIKKDALVEIERDGVRQLVVWPSEGEVIR